MIAVLSRSIIFAAVLRPNVQNSAGRAKNSTNVEANKPPTIAAPFSRYTYGSLTVSVTLAALYFVDSQSNDCGSAAIRRRSG